MKISNYHFLSLVLPAALGAQTEVTLDPNCCGNDPKGTVLEIRQAASADILRARRSGAAANGYKSASLDILTERVEINVEKASFLAGSEFLVGMKGFAIVPQGATVTPGHRLKITSTAPTDKSLQNWKQFQLEHPTAVRLLPITKEMLNGDEDALKTISQKVATLQKGGIAYVTTLNGNPVSLPVLSTTKS